MTDDQRDQGTPESAPQTGVEPSAAAGRRRFLSRGSAIGAGVVIMTVHHQRGFAQTRTLVVSSAAVCASLGGSAGGAAVYPEGTSLAGQTGIECNGVAAPTINLNPTGPGATGPQVDPTPRFKV